MVIWAIPDRLITQGRKVPFAEYTCWRAAMRFDSLHAMTDVNCFFPDRTLPALRLGTLTAAKRSDAKAAPDVECALMNKARRASSAESQEHSKKAGVFNDGPSCCHHAVISSDLVHLGIGG